MMSEAICNCKREVKKSATLSQERRRVAVAAREAVAALVPISERNSVKTDIVLEMLLEICEKLDCLNVRVQSLEDRGSLPPPPGLKHHPAPGGTRMLCSRLDSEAPLRRLYVHSTVCMPHKAISEVANIHPPNLSLIIIWDERVLSACACKQSDRIRDRPGYIKEKQQATKK